MKKHITIAAVIIAAAVHFAAFAQTPSDNSAVRAPKYDYKSNAAKINYLTALRSENAGLSESSMMQTAEIKMLYPSVNFDEIKSVTDSLAVNGSTPSIRYKAYLASNVLNNPGWFAKKAYSTDENPDQFFASIAGQLQELVLGSRTN